MAAATLIDGLITLGGVLEEEGLAADLVIIGGGALLLRGELQRPTGDLDVVARVKGGVLQASDPLPAPIVNAVRRVGRALDLAYVPRDAKDWLNAGPSYLTTIGLPEGFQSRLEARSYGALMIRVASRLDLIALKVFAASNPQRRARREIDVADLKRLGPTPHELLHALRWCRRVDGRPDFVQLDGAPLLRELGVDPRPLLAAFDGDSE